MAQLDRSKGTFAALARGTFPLIDYQRTYRVKLLQQRPNLRRVDLQADDPRLPPLSNIPLRLGIPGLDVTIPPGYRMMFAFEDARPDRPYATLWEPGDDLKPLKFTLHAQVIELGGHVTPIQDGVVTGQGKDPYTGMPYWVLGNSSTKVGAVK